VNEVETIAVRLCLELPQYVLRAMWRRVQACAPPQGLGHACLGSTCWYVDDDTGALRFSEILDENGH
jgi:hypothetical protein